MDKTRIALIGTISDLHRQPIRYDLAELERIVARAQPDLLGLEVGRLEFENGDLAHAPVEVREALIPLARRTDMVVIPLGEPSPEELAAPRLGWLLGLRAALIRLLDNILLTLQKTASGAREINSEIVSRTCGLLCHLEAYVSGESGRRAWERTNERLAANIAETVQHDPGTRILVAVQCRRKHWLEPKLKRLPGVELVPYWEF